MIPMKSYELIRENIELLLDDTRYRHSLGVEDEAVKLAAAYGIEEIDIRIAAIAHDCAKQFSDEELIMRAQKYNLQIDEIQMNFPQLLHGPVGAEYCRRHFGICDVKILNAIHYHTTGRRGMSLFEKIVYIADLIEPGRNFPGIDEIRNRAIYDFNGALIMACNTTLDYIIRKNYLIHPLTIEFRNSLLKGDN